MRAAAAGQVSRRGDIRFLLLCLLLRGAQIVPPRLSGVNLKGAGLACMARFLRSLRRMSALAPVRSSRRTGSGFFPSAGRIQIGSYPKAQGSDKIPAHGATIRPPGPAGRPGPRAAPGSRGGFVRGLPLGKFPRLLPAVLLLLLRSGCRPERAGSGGGGSAGGRSGGPADRGSRPACGPRRRIPRSEVPRLKRRKDVKDGRDAKDIGVR